MVVLATTRSELLREMAAAYPYVEVVALTPTAILATRMRFARALVVVPPSFVDVPFFMRLTARLMALGGTLAGYTTGVKAPRYAVATAFHMRRLFYENVGDMLEALGCPRPDAPALQFAEDTTVVDSLNSEYIVVAPFASNPGKTLPEKRWVELLHFLQTQFPERQLVILGGPSDAPLAAKMIVTAGVRAENYCGIPFAQVAALIKRTSCFIGIDSGLTHVAAALRAPSVIVDNLRVVTWLPAYNPKAIILTESKNCQCGGDKTGDCNYSIDGVSYLRCMYDVSDERIQAAVVQTLSA
jgi:ADP-heptose:LPS heptosyltransferase